MNKDQRLLEEAYQSIYESISEPLYFGPEEHKQKWKEWLAVRSLSWKVNPDGTIDVKGYCDLDGERAIHDPFKQLFPLTVLPFQFNKVEGIFDCAHNNLRSLKGSPRIAEGDFRCFHNTFQSLEGAPTIVKGDFIAYNAITSLKGCTQTIEGNFDCSYSKITSLEDGPRIVEGDFDCSYSRLVSLKGCPRNIKGTFDCSNNPNLHILEGGPETVEDDFDCGYTNLTSLKGAPKEIKGKFINYEFSDEDYRKYAQKIKTVEDNLSKDFDIEALEDF